MWNKTTKETWHPEFFRTKEERGEGKWLPIRGRTTYYTREAVDSFLVAERKLDAEQKVPNTYRIRHVITTVEEEIIEPTESEAA